MLQGHAATGPVQVAMQQAILGAFAAIANKQRAVGDKKRDDQRPP